MMKIIRTLKLSASLIGGASLLALTMFVGAPKAQAYETNILAGNDLAVGSRGQSVVVLQSLLSEFGYLTVAPGVALGYFGPATKAALGQYQLAQSVSPAAGYFGPVSKIAMHQQFASRGWLALLGW